MTAPIKLKLTRAEKNELTRKNLFEAAVQVVGKMGYRDASVADITAHAEVAQGTFYNYFESKQDILDQLLPELGQDLLEYLGEKVGDATFLEREEKGVNAYFQFIRDRPAFYRILTEAQVYAPESFKKHFGNLVQNYTHSLARTQENGFLVDYSPEEFEAIATILLGARVYLTSQFCFRTGKVRAVPEHVVQTFMKFVTMGFGRSQYQHKPIKPSVMPTMAIQSRKVTQVSNYEVVTHCPTPTELARASSAESDFFLQQLSSDLLHAAVESLLAGEARLRNTNIHMTLAELPSAISARCTIDYHSGDDGIISLKLTSAEDETVLLASVLANFIRT